MKKIGIRVLLLILLMFMLVGYTYIETKKTSLSKDASVSVNIDAYPVLSISRNGRLFNTMYPYTRSIPFMTADSYTYFKANEVIEFIFEDQPKTMAIQYEIINPLNQEVIHESFIKKTNIIQSDEHIRAQILMPVIESTPYPYMMKLTYKRDGDSLYYYQPFYVGDSPKIDYLYDTVMTIHKAALKGDEKTLNTLLPKVERSQDGTFSSVNKWTKMNHIMWQFGQDVLPMSEPKMRITTIDPDRNQYEVILNYTVAVRKNHEFEYWDFTESYQLSGTELINVVDYTRIGMMNIDRHKSTMQSILDLKKHTTIESIQSENGKFYTFVRDREVWVLDGRRESYYKVFGFDNLNGDYILDNYNQHKIKLLEINDSGILTYIVYGYMNTGLNRGKNGIALYQFNAITGENEEVAFIHMPYGLDKMENEVSQYMTVTEDLRMLHFFSDGAFYQVNLKEGLMKLINSDLPYDTSRIYIADNQAALFWEKETNRRTNQQIEGLTLDKYTITNRIESNEALYNHILGRYNNQFVVGYYDIKDTMEKLNGSMTYLYKELVILDDAGQVIERLKAPRGKYYDDIQWENNSISYHLVRKRRDVRSGPSRAKISTQEIVRQEYVFEQVANTMMPPSQLEAYTIDDRAINEIRKKRYIELIFDKENPRKSYELIMQGDDRGSYDTITDALLAVDKNKHVYILEKEEGQYNIMYAGVKREAVQIAGIPVIPQKPELPRGCEVTSLSMLLNVYLEDNVDKLQLADEVKKDPTAYEVKDGMVHFGNVHEGFVGDMYSVNKKGYAVYHEAIVELANKYMPGKVLNITGSELDHVLYYVGKGYPVWVISPNIYQKVPSTSIQQWLTPQGAIEMSYTQHSVLITGYDKDYIYFNDPSKNMVLKRRIEAFRAGWESFGNQAILVY